MKIRHRLAAAGAAIAITAAMGMGTAAAQAPNPQISLIHGIPGTVVDVMVDGQVVVDQLAPGTVADLSAFAGQTLVNLQVVASTGGAVVIGPVASLALPATGNWSYVAHLDAAGTPVLTPFENDVTPTAADRARLTVRHTAATGAVDLVVGADRPVSNVTNGSSTSLDLAATPITNGQLAPTGQAPIAPVDRLAMAAGTNTIVYAVGGPQANTLDFVVQVIDVGTVATGSTTTSTTIAGATTTTSTTNAVPTAVNTGSPIGDRSTPLILVALAAALIGGIALAARTRTH